MSEPESWEDEFFALFWYLPVDVQDRLKSMDDHDYAMLCSIDDRYLGVRDRPDGDAARMLEAARADLVRDRESYSLTGAGIVTNGGPTWCDMVDLAVDAALLALGRARRELAGMPVEGEEAYERTPAAKFGEPAEHELVTALLRYRFSRLIAQCTADGYTRAWRKQHEAKGGPDPEEPDLPELREAEARVRRRRFKVVGEDDGEDEP